ncbi:retrovirus-related Pol polyprotein from transposon 17.6 [Trichonephila clavipes]|nr:retrovirus-related Pol polyprotein from transposon 17.6 [Trichonephila clavipes]
MGYYSHYIPNYSTIASPLTDALKGKIKKEKITWDEKCGKAFEELKAKLVSQPILFAPDFATDFILQTDASETRPTIVGPFNCERNRFRGSGLSPYIHNGELYSKAVKLRQWAEGARLSVHVSDTCWFVKKPGWKNREKEGKRKGEREKEGKRARKRQGLDVLGSGEENPRVLFGDADQESETRMSKNALRTGRRQAVE